MQNTQDTFKNQKQNRFGSPLVEINRTFKAPVELVWETWSQPELVKQWWGPESFTCPEAKIDFKVGGKSLLAMQDSKGNIVWSTGTYQEIVPLEKIVTTDSFADKNGKIISAKSVGLSGNWPETCYITITFASPDAETTNISIKHEGIPAEMHDDCVEGWNSSLNKFQILVENNYPI